MAHATTRRQAARAAFEAAQVTSRRQGPARRAADLLRAEFAQNRSAGRLLPSEHALMRELGVSRNVVRDALAELVREGLVYRVRSKGTIARARADAQPLRELKGLSDLLPGDGPGRLRNVILSAEVVPTPRPIAARLDVPAGADSVLIERLRILDDIPLSLETSWLPAGVAARVLDFPLATRDLFAILEQDLRLRPASATVSIEALTAEEVTTRFLEMSPGIALLLVTRLARLADGRPIALEFLRYRGDRMTLEADMSRALAPESRR